MKFLELSTLSRLQKEQILALWNREYPEAMNQPDLKSFEEYLDKFSEGTHILLLDQDKKIKGWYFGFTRDGERWFAIILDREMQGKGLGTRILNRAKEKEEILNGWVIDHNKDRRKDGSLYPSPLNFYLKNGFHQIPEIRRNWDHVSAVKIRWSRTSEG